MNRMTTLSDLLARLEAATEGSVELDTAIQFVRLEFVGFVEPPIPAYTTSLDAITALIAEVLPSDWAGSLDWDSDGAQAWLTNADYYIQSHTAATPALALCIALVRALQAKDS